MSAVTRAAVNAQVKLQVTDTRRIFAVITCQSVDDLQLAPGRNFIAITKSSFVLLGRLGDAARFGAEPAGRHCSRPRGWRRQH